MVGASPTYVPAPGLVGGAAMRRSLLADPAMEDVAARWQDLTMALVGIGSLQPSALLQQSGNAIAPADQDRSLRAGCGGRRLHPLLRRRRPPGAPRPGLAGRRHRPRHLPSRIPRRIGFAGWQRKHAAVRAAIAGNWVNVVVTDLETARALLAAA